ncbi:hypothetical protein V9K67_05265 [Paraflavisolibacter sp. H34]|uniref:hypothetical protein n=1 Tax=Huijunlia imazamoxiresistens TaxID=3127457 RepID=UPI003016DCFD
MSGGKPDGKRGRVAFIFVILLGYVLGIFIKKVQLGLVLGLVIGLLASGLLRRR